MHIAFFDSGLGGLNTLKVALTQMPGEKFIYYGDTANVPYGTKSAAEVRDLLVQAVDHLQSYRLKAFVIACNTATSVGASFLRQKYPFPIIGMEPAIKPAVELLAGRGKRIMLLATILTLKSEKIAKLRAKVDPDGLTDAVACSELVEFAERLEFDQDLAANFLKQKLSAYDLNKYEVVVLGSTHFSYFQGAIKAVFPAGTKIVDGNQGTVNHLIETLPAGGQPSENAKLEPEVLVHLTDASDAPKRLAVKKMIEEASPSVVKFI